MDRENFDLDKFNISPEDLESLCRLDNELKDDPIECRKQMNEILSKYSIKAGDSFQIREYIKGISGAYSEEELAEIDAKNKKLGNRLVAACVVLVVLYIAWANYLVPDACECVDVLALKKDHSTYVSMSDDTYEKWEDCYDYYKGTAGAMLECMK